MPHSNLQRLREISGHLVDPDIAIGIFELLPDAIVVVDTEGRIQLVNRQAELILGYPRKEMFDQPVEILLPEDLRHKHVHSRTEYVLDPHLRPMGLHAQKLIVKRKDGLTFRAQINLSPLVTPMGLLVLAVIRRVSEQRWTADHDKPNTHG